MDDRRRNRDLHHITSLHRDPGLRDLAERVFRGAIVVGAIAGWSLIAHACLGG